MSSQSLDLDSIEARAARATEDLELNEENRGAVEFDEGYSLKEKKNMLGIFERKPDAELAASAKNDILSLVNECRKLEKELDNLKDIRKELESIKKRAPRI
jgi:hypothetical protein